MATGGRVVYKRGGGRKRRSWPDSDDDDQEYVAAEDELDSSDESLVSSPDEEESFGLAESSDGEAAAAAPRSKPRRGKPKKVELELSSVPRRRAATRSRRRRPSASEDDEDFNPDEDDDDDDEELVVVSDRKSSYARKRAPRRRPKKGNPRVLNRDEDGVRKGRRKRAPSSEDGDDDDDDFVIKDRIALDKMRKNSRKPKKRTGVRKRRSAAVDSEDDDLDFIVSDEDEEEDGKQGRKKNRKTVTSRKPRSNVKRKRFYVEESELEPEFDSFVSDEEVREVSDQIVNVKKPKGPTRRKKRRFAVDSGSSDSDYEISEGELRDLRMGGVLDQQQPERLFERRQSEGKGKEKEREEPAKQVCGICLSEEQKGTIRGVLDSCAHYFCFACIMEWSKVESRCPMCKQRFWSIRKSAKLDPGFGLRTAVVRVPKRDQVYEPSEEEMRGLIDPYENVVCIVCQTGGDDNVMLLCDICDSSAHTYCVGLDREVPEGNWYCEACRSVDDGPSYIQNQGSINERGGSSSRLFSFGMETDAAAINMQSSSAQRPVSITGRSFSQGFDLNVSPRNNLGEDSFTASQASGPGPSTLSGRRAIHQRIRFILSSNANRVRQMFLSTRVPHGNVEMELNTSAVEPGVEAMNFASDGLNYMRNSQPMVHSNLNLSRCMFDQGNSLRHVDGAKERVQSIVKDHLKRLSKDISLDHDAYKDIARRCTHTILAACGIEHRRNKVVGPIHPPNACPHNLLYDGPADLVKSCCSSCFSSFAEDVVLRVMKTVF